MATGDQQLVLFVCSGPHAGRCVLVPVGMASVLTDEATGIAVVAGAAPSARVLLERTADTPPTARPGASAVTVNGLPLVGPAALRVGDQLGFDALSVELRTRPVQVAETLAPSDTSAPSLPPVPVADPGQALLQPDEIVAGRYAVERKLAQGGMGEVYEVRHVELDRPFALKVMRGELSGAPEFAERFKREAIASSRIGHPNIVDITDFGRTEQGSFFFVMELLEGETLGAIIERDGPQPVTRLLHLARQLCGALAAAHDKGIVHRDLKPENVMVVQRPGAPDHVKLVDFGIAKVDAAFGGTGQTSVGMLVGTPRYMSPEQASGLPLDRRTDIYSLGLIFYELLTGKPAFDAPTPPQVMVQQISSPPPPLPDALAASLPPGVTATLFRMLAKRPDERPQTMDEVLRGFGETPLFRPPPSAPRPPRQPGAPRTPTPPRNPSRPAALPRPITSRGPTVAARPVTPAPRPEPVEAVVASAVLRPPARWPMVLAVVLVVGVATAALLSPRGAARSAAQGLPGGSGEAPVEPRTERQAERGPAEAAATRAPALGEQRAAAVVTAPSEAPATARVEQRPAPQAEPLAPAPVRADAQVPEAAEATRSARGPTPSRPPKRSGGARPATSPPAPRPAGELKDAFADELKEDE